MQILVKKSNPQRLMVWDFKSSSYRIRRLWLDNHKMYRDPDDLRHYRNIVSTLREIKNIMEDIKVRIQTANREEIFTKVKEVVTNNLGVEANSIIPSANFVNDLGADSLDTVELVMALEETFKIEIPDDIAEKILTVQQIVDYIADQQKLAT